MDFWQRVEEICDSKGINKKEIAAIAKIDPSTISHGLKNHTCPAADIAVAIAQKLETTVEYLVTGQYSAYEKYSEIYRHTQMIKSMLNIPTEVLSSIELMINDMSQKYQSSKHN